MMLSMLAPAGHVIVSWTKYPWLGVEIYLKVSSLKGKRRASQRISIKIILNNLLSWRLFSLSLCITRILTRLQWLVATDLRHTDVCLRLANTRVYQITGYTVWWKMGRFERSPWDEQGRNCHNNNKYNNDSLCCLSCKIWSISKLLQHISFIFDLLQYCILSNVILFLQDVVI